MTRQSLWSVIALGAVIASLSGAGVVAVFSDSATTGTNNASSGDQVHLDALQIAATDLGPGGLLECGTFSADLQTGLLSATGMQPGDVQQTWLCLRNDFTAPLSLSASAIDLVDSDPYCTNDEASFDTSCTPPDAGELSGVLWVTFRLFANDCYGAPAGLGSQSSLDADQALGDIAAGQTLCVSIEVSYPPSTSVAQQQAAQTDEASWRFQFRGNG